MDFDSYMRACSELSEQGIVEVFKNAHEVLCKGEYIEAEGGHNDQVHYVFRLHSALHCPLCSDELAWLSLALAPLDKAWHLRL